MDFDLHPKIPVSSGTFTLVVSPLKMAVGSLNRCDEIQRYTTLYVCGNYSQILSGIHRTRTNLDIRRAFTAYQLLTILEEAYHTIIFIEHDPSLYEGDGRRLIFPASMAMREAARDAAVILYSPQVNYSLRRIAKKAERIYYFEDYVPPRKVKRDQSTLDQIGEE